MNLTEARERANKSREVVAVSCGVSVSAFRAWEKGHNIPPSSVLPKIQDVLGLTDSEVLEIVRSLQREAS